ncbi:MAG TPA: hypothetical protein VF190_14450 [Rhodothermales bacterium]
MAQPLQLVTTHESATRHVKELLEQLHVCGERLFDALISNDLERALTLLDERDRLVVRLSALNERPDEQALRPLAASLRAQNDRIADALDLRRQALEKAIEETVKLRRGHESYTARPERRKVLHAGLEA